MIRMIFDGLTRLLDRMMPVLIIALVTLVMTAIVFSAVFAQSAPPGSGGGVVGEVPTPENTISILMGALSLALASVSSGALVTAVVGILKNIPPFTQVSGDLIKLAVSVVVVLLAWGANYLGLQSQFNTAASVVTAVLVALMGGTVVSSQAFYTKVFSGVPIIGTTREGIPAAIDAKSQS